MSEMSLPGADYWNDHAWARMSFSRLAAWQRCPAWYRHTALDWHATWTTPVQEAGHVVQSVLQAVFDNTPATDVTAADIGARASARVQQNLHKAWERATQQYAENPNAVGSFDIAESVYAGYAQRGIAFHMQEVEAWLKDRHPRSGARIGLPAYGAVSDAWTSVRPWHAPDVAPGEYWNEVIPQGWFQGQYDLVYEWTGGRRIVDLKASTGKSVFSTEIRQQLLAYAFMERALGRGAPEGLEAWFLGAPEPRLFEVPAEEETQAFGESVKTLLWKSGVNDGAVDHDAFAPAPAALPGHAVPAGAASAWCSVCPAALTCPLSGRSAPSAGGGVALGAQLAQGHDLSIEGLVCGVKSPRTKESRDGATKTTRRITLVNEGGYSTFGWDERDCQRLFREGLRAGRVVRISGLKSWATPDGSRVLYFSGPRTHCTVLSESWERTGVVEDDAPALGE